MRYLIISLLIAGQSFAQQREIDKDPFAWLEKEWRIVALTLMGEARGEKAMGLYAVACVVNQRMKERKLTAAQVCWQDKQFSCWNRKGGGRKKIEDLNPLLLEERSNYAIKLAIDLCKGKNFERRIVGFANHYCTLDAKPFWTFKTIVREGKDVKIPIPPVMIIGNHKFYKLK
jgi:hypothetical protein